MKTPLLLLLLPLFMVPQEPAGGCGKPGMGSNFGITGSKGVLNTSTAYIDDIDTLRIWPKDLDCGFTGHSLWRDGVRIWTGEYDSIIRPIAGQYNYSIHGFTTSFSFGLYFKNPPTAIAEIGVSEKTRIFPNPTTGRVFFDAEDAVVQEVTLTTVGSIRRSYTGPLRDLNLEDLSKGLYFVTVLLDDGTRENGKLILQTEK